MFPSIGDTAKGSLDFLAKLQEEAFVSDHGLSGVRGVGKEHEVQDSTQPLKLAGQERNFMSSETSEQFLLMDAEHTANRVVDLNACPLLLLVAPSELHEGHLVIELPKLILAIWGGVGNIVLYVVLAKEQTVSLTVPLTSLVAVKDPYCSHAYSKDVLEVGRKILENFQHRNRVVPPLPAASDGTICPTQPPEVNLKRFLHLILEDQFAMQEGERSLSHCLEMIHTLCLSPQPAASYAGSSGIAPNFCQSTWLTRDAGTDSVGQASALARGRLARGGNSILHATRARFVPVTLEFGLSATITGLVESGKRYDLAVCECKLTALMNFKAGRSPTLKSGS